MPQNGCDGLSDFSRGDIYYADFPQSSHHEQAGRRPAIVVADIPPTNMVVVIPLTRTLEASELPYARRLALSAENGLAEESIALLFQIRALDKRRFGEKLGVIGSKELEAIKAMLADMFKLGK